MALWGNTDSKTATGTVDVDTAGAVTGTTTAFTTEAAVGDYMVVAGENLLITAIADNTNATVAAGVPGASITAATGAAYALTEKPLFPTMAESASSSGVHGDPAKVFGVDTTEMGVTDNNGHAGWTRRVAYTDTHGNARVKYETLVAGGTISTGAADAADDTEFPDS